MRTLGDYTLLEALGSSELGAMHLAATDLPGHGDKASCVLEILDPEIAAESERVASMLLEVAAARRFEHPAVDPVFGAGRSVTEGGGERIWVARPAPSGWSLGALLDFADRVNEQLLVQVSVWLTARIAEAVAAAHGQGLIHGALAPESVRMTPEAEVYLRDLGLGSLLGGSERRLAFRAPELLLADLLTPRADVYSLGMILTTCLIGHPPFERHDPISTRRAVLEHRFPRVRASRPALSPRVDDLLARLCALEPESRPSSAGEVAEMLSEVLGPSESLVPSVLRRQLMRVPLERAFDPEAVERSRARLAAQTQTEASAGLDEVAPRGARTLSGRGRLAGAEPALPTRGPIAHFALDLQVSAEGPIEVYEAVDLGSGTPARLRVLDAEASGTTGGLPADVWRTCFAQEAALAGNLAHPSILGFRGSGEDKGLRWIAYAPPPRDLLADRIARGPDLDAVSILLDLSLAVAHLHDRGILACGLGTRAVRVSSRGLAVFSELSCLAPVGGALHPRIEEDPFGLTPELAGARRHDPRSDLFLLGVIAYELLTGTRPFRGLDRWSVLEAVRTRPPRPPSELEPSVEPRMSALVMRLLERDPSQRPESADIVAAELRSLRC